MAYRQSELDRKNLAKFSSDETRCSLKSIALKRGAIRGLSNFRIDFTYPLSAIAGKNGSGKTTVLALAACAFHGTSSSWRLPTRSLPYYRFSDFFFQTHDEIPVDGVSIAYEILHNRWKPTDELPEGRGLGFQTRWKNKGGKWNDYASRAKRPVAYFGIERVVPPSERTTIKNQRRYFTKASQKSETEEATKISVSKILGVPYEDLELRAFGAYKLPIVKIRDNKYSGFNMGAGEQALFNLFTAIHSAPRGSLFVIDEIELGLHEAAQKQLIDELKQIAFSSAHQFIFTTHSPAVLGSLPPEARFFLDKGPSGTKVVEGISPAFAAGRLSDKSKPELVIYAEDVCAKQLILAGLSHETRRRIKVVDVGASSAVISQLAARFIDKVDSDCDVVGILDGDQRAALQTHRARFLGLIDQRRRDLGARWIDEHLTFLPTEMAPERFVVSKIRAHYSAEFSERFQIESPVEGEAMLDKALVRGGHSEIYWLAEDLAFSEEQIWMDLCSILASKSPDDFAFINTRIDELLVDF